MGSSTGGRAAAHGPNPCVRRAGIEPDQSRVYAAVFRRFCKLSGATHDDPSDPLVRATFEAIAAYEQTLQEKHAKNVKATRTRQKIARKGVYQSLLEWSELHGNRPGFRSLIEAGLPDFTFEAVVVRFADRFPPGVVASCRETLTKAGASPD